LSTIFNPSEYIRKNHKTKSVTAEKNNTEWEVQRESKLYLFSIVRIDWQFDLILDSDQINMTKDELCYHRGP